MEREKLERLIVDASDGVLSSHEIKELENKLRDHPELYEDYRAIMNLPDIADIYQADLETGHYQFSIQKIQRNIREISEIPNSFEVISLNWFRRYALAASLAIFAVTSLFSFIQSDDDETDSEVVVEEMFYPVENSLADNYVLYFEDLTEE